ncbi:MAG: M18 family aminopeptidase [Deltaproteobacteria bacterium]|nr:M18 family aminopeptidase [Deltaproteobacteria bacterium]
MSDAARDLLRFIDASPTPYHAVAEASRRLERAGFTRVAETEAWALAPGARHYLVRSESSLLAFEVGEAPLADAGFHAIGAHTDSPNLRVKPAPDITAHGLRQLAIEPYGGVLLHTWLDRDLSLAGRVVLATASGLRSVTVDFARPLLRIPNLAIHLQRETKTEGLKLNEQTHLVPVLGLEGAPPLAELVASELRAQGHGDATASAIHGFDLMLYDTQSSCVSGARGEFLHAPRLDNLASCHAALSALTSAQRAPLPAFSRVVVLYDHEEVGSRSAQGAQSGLLADTLARIESAAKSGGPQGFARAMARSLLVSADMAHAVHPNYSDRHEPGHRPKLGGGPVLKVNSNQSYASDAVTLGHFTALCRARGIDPQHFVARSDLGCGSTIGPISAARAGIRTVDVGSPMLSMHSCREMAAVADVEPMISVLRGFFETALDLA